MTDNNELAGLQATKAATTEDVNTLGQATQAILGFQKRIEEAARAAAAQAAAAEAADGSAAPAEVDGQLAAAEDPDMAAHNLVVCSLGQLGRAAASLGGGS